MLYDEPTTGLDPIMSDVINELILQTQRTKKTTGVVVTHDMKTVAKVADRVVMLYPLARLEPGEPQVIYDGPPDGLEDYPDPRVRQFVRGEAGERLRELAGRRENCQIDEDVGPTAVPAEAARPVATDRPRPRPSEDGHERTRHAVSDRHVRHRGGPRPDDDDRLVRRVAVAFRDHVFVKVRYMEAPGVSEGIPVRKSGIRIGEVAAIAFDERPGPARRRARDPLARAEIQAQGGIGPAALAVADRRRRDRHPARGRARGT